MDISKIRFFCKIFIEISMFEINNAWRQISVLFLIIMSVEGPIDIQLVSCFRSANTILPDRSKQSSKQENQINRWD